MLKRSPRLEGMWLPTKNAPRIECMGLGFSNLGFRLEYRTKQIYSMVDFFETVVRSFRITKMLRHAFVKRPGGLNSQT